MICTILITKTLEIEVDVPLKDVDEVGDYLDSYVQDVLNTEDFNKSPEAWELQKIRIGTK